MIRKIIHIDMDAFFASVEQRNRPELKGKAIAVGGSSNRGVVAAASYEARKFGVRSAMPTHKAMALCPHLILIKGNGKAYKEVSEIIQGIFHEYTDLVEPLSLDEAFMDVTFHKKGVHSATLIATEIRERILAETQLTASAGISYNKFLAKIASDINKPNGMFVIPPEDAISFLSDLKIDQFFGIGKVSAEKFHSLGIHTGKDLRRFDKNDLVRWFGKAGNYYYNIVRGIDNREVKPFRERKSIGAEQTFEKDIDSVDELNERLYRVIDRMWKTVERKTVAFKTVSLKLKYFDFEVITRSKTVDFYMDSKKEMINIAVSLLRDELPLPKAVRLIGVTVSNFEKENTLPE
ncbi:MAG: DNA polymerase IV, partial [Prolixibacteraceae bacterium]|nr:DNA polymerase IV [Prolixibacteraceae bacterium]